MKDNQVFFNIKDNKVKLSYKDKSLTIVDLLQVTSTGILCAMQSIVQAAPEEMRQSVKEDLYDTYNLAASNLLSFFAPEIEARPNLTTQAILKAENEIIEKEYTKTVLDPKYRSPIAENPNIKIVK